MLKSIVRICTVSLLSLSAAACASKGFNRGALKDEIGVTKPVYDDKEIKEAYNKKTNLPKPFKLAVYFKTAEGKRGQSDWRWSEEDKAQFDEIGAELKKKGIVSDVFPLISSLVTSDDLHALRLVAAKHGADALLVVTGAADIDRYINGWGWSYALLLPALFVPGSKADTLFMASATMWDVKNEYLYLTAETEATTSDTYIAAFGKKDKDLINAAKSQAGGKLKAELTRMIEGTKL
jgi:hypothetical protein